jgi:hypothetical protein
MNGVELGMILETLEEAGYSLVGPKQREGTGGLLEAVWQVVYTRVSKHQNAETSRQESIHVEVK